MPIKRTLARITDKRGVAAVEFAILAPVLVVGLFGAIEVTDLMNANRRMQNAAASIADVVSRDTAISDDEISDIWKAGEALMFPYDESTLQVRVTSVSIEDANSAEVVWSDGFNGYAPLAVGSSVALPAGLMIPGTTVIQAETKYKYQPVTHIILDYKIDLSHKEYRRPRIQDQVTRD